MVSLQEPSVPIISESIAAHFADTPLIHPDLLVCKRCDTYASYVRVYKHISCSLMSCGVCKGEWCVCKVCQTRYGKSNQSGHIKCKTHADAAAMSDAAEAAKKGDCNEHHQEEIDRLGSSDEDPSTKKRKLIDAFKESAGHAADIRANLKRVATADFYKEEKTSPNLGARRLVGGSAARIQGQHAPLATPRETMYHLKTTEFLLSLSDSQMEKYADLMTTAVTGLLTKDESQKVFQSSGVYTGLSDVKEFYLKGKHSIVYNLPHRDTCMTESDGNHAIASIRDLVATRTTMGKNK
jgi:hypothetical protein